MSDHPPEIPGRPVPEPGADARSRSLSEILEELATLSHAHQGEASAMRGAVSELSRALARLFEMIRADRSEQRERITELERALATAQARVRELETEEEPLQAPAANDFDQLRVAAERLRRRTEQIVQEAGTPADEARREEEARSGAARADLPSRPVHDEPFGAPGILRVFPGAVLGPRADDDDDIDVESELQFDEAPRRVAAQAIPVAAEPEWAKPSQMKPPEPLEPEPDDDTAHPATDAADDPVQEALAEGAADLPASYDDAPPPPTAPASTAAAPAAGTVPLVKRPEPIAVAPRPARKRRATMRRRRIDARKLAGVDPGAALRAMVGSIDQLWTAGCPLDLVVALTDGGAIKIAGGDLEPLRVEEVEPGAPARTTVTATSDQIVPLFGRLAVTDEQSAPLIHGSRRDADLLVGWIDRAQRLSAEPL